MLPLDERLNMLAALVPACDMAADIGADHGFLGAHLVESGRVRHVQLLDISADSLNKARRLIAQEGLEDRVTFGVGDGTEAMSEAAQAVIIAGMGGATIAGIVSRGRVRLGEATLILEPNVRAQQLRETLARCGYRIDREEIARAAGRWYVGIRAVPGEADYTRRELLVGPALLTQGHPLLGDYAAFKVRVLKKALTGVRTGEGDRARRIAGEIEEELSIWEGIQS